MHLPEYEKTAVDIIIPTRNRGKLIDVTLESIRHSTHQNWIVWVADQSDDNQTETAVFHHAQTDPRIRYLSMPPMGSSKARNDGACFGHAPIILFTDDDCRVEPDWITSMLEELSQPDTWAAFGRIEMEIDQQITLTQEEQHLLNVLPMAKKNSQVRKVYDGNRFNLGFGHGANMGFRREYFDAVNGFDELLGAGAPLRSWPERDIGYRILRQNGRIVYTPHAIVHHRHWRSWQAVKRTYRNYAIGTGAAVGKYLRCGDSGSLYLLAEWMFDQGIRQLASGLIKWHSHHKMMAGLLQLAFPWVGLYMGFKHKINKTTVQYKSKFNHSPAVSQPNYYTKPAPLREVQQ